MKFTFSNIIIKITLFLSIVLGIMACESNLNEVRKINFTSLNPIGEAKEFNLKYTDSGKIKAILISPQMLDYSNLEFPFSEFPKGIKVTIFDDAGNKNYVTANYAVSFSNSNLIDLQKNVIITTHDGKQLKTEQLYYDQANEWFFTQQPYQFINKSNVINGTGIDFSKDFKTLDTQQISGVYGI